MFDSDLPLGDHLLDALRDGPPAPAEARARVRARLAAVIPAMGVVSDGKLSGSDSRPGPFRRVDSLSRRATALVAFVAGAATTAAVFMALGAPVPRLRHVDPLPQNLHVEPARSETTTLLGSVAASAPDVGAPVASEVRPTSPPPRHRDRSQTVAITRESQGVPSRISQLNAERLLLDEAHTALEQGDPQRALGYIEAHRAQYPQALLGEERDALNVKALVRAGRSDEARKAAASFQKRAPSSLFLPTIQGATSSLPASP